MSHTKKYLNFVYLPSLCFFPKLIFEFNFSSSTNFSSDFWSRLISSQASERKSSIRNLSSNCWNSSIQKIREKEISSRRCCTEYTESSSDLEHSSESKSITFSSGNISTSSSIVFKCKQFKFVL